MTDNHEEKSEKNQDIKFISDFFTKERDHLKTEINQIKQGQITLLTATISAVALIFTFLFNFKDNGYCPEIYMFLPLLILIPSSVIFFHKAYEVNEKTAYIQLINDKLLNKSFFEDYKSYETYKPEFDSKMVEKISTKTTEGKFNSFCKIIFANFGNRFWSMAFWAYTGLIIINFIVPRHLLNSTNVNQIAFNYFMILLSICIIIPYLIGKSYGKPDEYWKKFGKYSFFCVFQLPYLIFLVILLGLILGLYSNIEFFDYILNQPQIFNIIYTIVLYIPNFVPIYGSALVLSVVIITVIVFLYSLNKYPKYDQRKYEILSLLAVLSFLFISAGLASSFYTNILELEFFIVIVISITTILFCFSETWNLKFGYKSIDILRIKWGDFIKDFTQEQKNIENDSKQNIEEKEKDQNDLKSYKAKNIVSEKEIEDVIKEYYDDDYVNDMLLKYNKIINNFISYSQKENDKNNDEEPNKND